MKVLVCGATGFIGRNIAKNFAQRDDFELYGTYFKSDPPNIPNATMLQVDFTDKDEVDKAIRGMEIVIQAAATTSGAKDIVTKPYYHVTDNAVMNSIIFRSAHENQVSRVLSSYFKIKLNYPN